MCVSSRTLYPKSWCPIKSAMRHALKPPCFSFFVPWGMRFKTWFFSMTLFSDNQKCHLSQLPISNESYQPAWRRICSPLNHNPPRNFPAKHVSLRRGIPWYPHISHALLGQISWATKSHEITPWNSPGSVTNGLVRLYHSFGHILWGDSMNSPKTSAWYMV